MILYFSGTGNSQYIAEIMNKELKDEILNITDEFKSIKTYQSNKPYIFVLPTYCYRIPRIIEEFIKQREFKGNKQVYIILTCGDSIGNAYKYAKKLIKDKNMIFKGLTSIIMPENYIALFQTPSHDEALDIVQKGKEKALTIIDYIKKEQDLPVIKDNVIGEILSGIGNEFFYKVIVNDKGFTVNDSCIHCLKCVELCPLDNIKYINKELVFQNHCTHCMSCINSCPKEAIVYKNRTQNKNHYHLKKIIK